MKGTDDSTERRNRGRSQSEHDNDHAFDIERPEKDKIDFLWFSIVNYISCSYFFMFFFCFSIKTNEARICS